MPSHDDKPSGAFLSRLKTGLSKTRELLLMNVEAIARGIGPVDEHVLTELEEALILSDAGADLAREYVVTLRAMVNPGTAESGYGYWFPGRNNDAATGGAWMVPMSVA